MFENFHPRQQLDTIEDHHNKRTIEDQSCWWVTTLKSYFFWQQLDTIEGPPQQTYFIYIYFVCAKISCKYSLNNWLIMLHKMKKTKSEKKHAEKNRPQKKTWHNTGPPNHLHKFWIILEKLDTIPTHGTNQDPTLYVYGLKFAP